MENSAFGRLIGVLVAPGKTFRSIAERPTWLAAFLVVALCPVIPAIIAMPKMDWEGITRSQLERADVQLPQDQLEQRIEITEKVGPYFAYAAPVFFAIGLLLFALIFWGAFTLAGGELGFKRSLAVVSHGMMPVVVSTLLSLPIIIGLDKIGADVAEQGSYLKSNLAAFAPEGANAVVLNLLSHLDVFSIWTLILLIIGFAICGKVKQSTSAITVILLWLVYCAIGVGFAALGMAMGGGGKG
jgi:hypothetical protein